MAGFNYEAGRSNNMVAAEERGLVTIGRWARRYKVSAAAAVAVMRPGEAHHTGTGRRGKSRLTPVIDGSLEPTAEQVAAMQEHDRAAKAAKEVPPRREEGCVVRYLRWPTSRTARRIPTEVIGPRTVLFFADGRIEAVDSEGRQTTHWHKLSGLVIARGGGLVYHANCNLAYDQPEAIAARICR